MLTRGRGTPSKSGITDMRAARLDPGPGSGSQSDEGGESDLGHAIHVHLGRLLADRGITLTELADRTGIAIVNLSIMKNGHARAIRFTTLSKICDVLGCQPGDLISHSPRIGRFQGSQVRSP